MADWSATTDHKFLQLDDDMLGEYNAWDVEWCGQLAIELYKYLTITNQREHYEKHIKPLQRAVIDMQRRGLLLDKEELGFFSAETKAELDECDYLIKEHADLHGFAYTDTFPNSDKQVSEFLFGTLCLKPGPKTESGRPSVSQAALMSVLRKLRQKDEEHRQCLYNLFHRSRLQKILSSYLKFDPDPDGRVRPEVKMCGTKTWRFAYANPPLHSQPPETRVVFCAGPGNILLSVDYSQLEARIQAVLANDPQSLEAFRNGVDIHSQNAVDLGFGGGDREGVQAAGSVGEGAADASASVSKEARSYAKGFLYRISYGGEGSDKEKLTCPCDRPRCVSQNPPVLELTKEKKAAAESRWFRKHPAVRAYHKRLEETVLGNRDYFGNQYYESPMGGRRYLSQPWSRDLMRELKNLPQQEAAAKIMGRAQILLFENKAPVCLQHHDSFVLEVPEHSLDHWAALVKGIMEEPVPELGGAVFPADVQAGQSWGKLSDYSG